MVSAGPVSDVWRWLQANSRLVMLVTLLTADEDQPVPRRAPPAERSSPERAELLARVHDIISEAGQLRQHAEFDRALRLYDEVLELVPENVEIILMVTWTGLVRVIRV